MHGSHDHIEFKERRNDGFFLVIGEEKNGKWEITEQLICFPSREDVFRYFFHPLYIKALESKNRISDNV